jgi:hypothetical protein
VLLGKYLGQFADYAVQRVRSGSHLERIGDVWYYRRVVPPDVRNVFGKRNIRVSLRTTSRAEAMRLEKEHDVDFESRLQAARATGPDGYPRIHDAKIGHFIEKILKETNRASWEQGLATIPQVDRTEVREAIELLDEARTIIEKELDDFWHEELRELLFLLFYEKPVAWDEARAVWAEARAELVEIVRNYHGDRSDPTIEWAYEEWLKARHRPQQTQDEARRYFDEFKKSAHLHTLAAIRRRHVADCALPRLKCSRKLRCCLI